MNEKNKKYANMGLFGAVIFAVGACTGAVGSYFYCKHEFNKELDFRYDQLKKAHNKIGTNHEELDEYMRKKETQKKEASKPVEPSPTDVIKYETLRTNYQSYFSEGSDKALNEAPSEDDGDSDEVEEEVNAIVEEAIKDVTTKKRRPYVIDEDMVGLADGPAIDEQFLLYFSSDGVLSTEDYTIIDGDERYAWLGTTLEESGFLEDPSIDKVCVRNEEMRVDYVVEKYIGSIHDLAN